MKTALSDILSLETGSYVAVGLATVRGASRCTRWNIFHTRLHLRDVIPAHQND
jgi:hypothetical protein